MKLNRRMFLATTASAAVLTALAACAKNGSGSTIVWNPWAQAAATMSDVGTDEWQYFVCVETAAVRERALTLWPGHPHIMTQSLAVETLD